MPYKVLAINPGSTSTKIAIYEDEKLIFVENLKHTADEIAEPDQLELRKNLILSVIEKKQFDIKTLDAIAGRGGLLKSIEGGTYLVNDAMIRDLKIGVQGQHASNLGGIIAHEIAESLNIPAYIVDPVIVDEFDEVARISGMPEIKRKSIFHALNQKAMGRRYAKENGKKYEDLNLIIAHMGGGISVGAHKKGRVVDSNNALDSEGPFSPDRSGGVPVGDLVRLCYSGKYTCEEMLKKVTGKGGYVAYLNTNDAKNVEERAAAGDKKAQLIQDAMAYQISKEIGICAVVLEGKVDAIILTGGIAYGKAIVNYIKGKVKFIAPVVVYPGEDELLALAQGGLRVLNGEERAKEYK